MTTTGRPLTRAPEILLATRNRGKVDELRELLAPLGRRVIDLGDAALAPTPDEDGLEDAPTFEANALAKARHFARRSPGRAVLADDSGLCVAALGGAPGVYSRRYAGATGTDAEVTAANSAKLLRKMTGVAQREAEFVCAVAYIDAAGELVTTGRVRGRILEMASGSRGFGYDPLFWSDELGCSFADATEREKAEVSHRARAVARLLEMLSPSGTKHDV